MKLYHCTSAKEIDGVWYVGVNKDLPTDTYSHVLPILQGGTKLTVIANVGDATTGMSTILTPTLRLLSEGTEKTNITLYIAGMPELKNTQTKS